MGSLMLTSRFADFRGTLDAEMKRLKAAGLGTLKKQAEPLTVKEERDC